MRKMYNPTPKPFNFRFKETFVSIPVHETIVVSEDIALYVQEHYATIEISDATEKEYKEYRKLKDDKEKELKAEALKKEQAIKEEKLEEEKRQADKLKKLKKVKEVKVKKIKKVKKVKK